MQQVQGTTRYDRDDTEVLENLVWKSMRGHLEGGAFVQDGGDVKTGPAGWFALVVLRGAGIRTRLSRARRFSGGESGRQWRAVIVASTSPAIEPHLGQSPGRWRKWPC